MGESKCVPISWLRFACRRSYLGLNGDLEILARLNEHLHLLHNRVKWWSTANARAEMQASAIASLRTGGCFTYPDRVLHDHGNLLLPVVVFETCSVQNLHLLENGALAGFTRACNKARRSASTETLAAAVSQTHPAAAA